MKQELRNFHAYLPYHVGVEFDGRITGILYGIQQKILFELVVCEDIDNGTPIFNEWCAKDTKLVLKPLHLLDRNNTEWERLMCDALEKAEYDHNHLSVSDYEDLLENHYDVMGLIDSGYAVAKTKEGANI